MSRCDLLGRVRDGSFREDLFYRLSSPCIDVPPLRERPDDIPLLARHFIDKHASMMEVPPAPLSARAIDELLRYAWPGNVRELEHVIERALAFCRGEEIRPEHVLPLERASDVSAPHAPELSELTGSSLAETVADIERRMILMALKQANGNQVRAAQKLGIPRTTLRDKMARYSIPVS
jgi:DNA-binding NtrC family response regulator